MAEKFVTESELFNGDPSLTESSVDDSERTYTFYKGDETTPKPGDYIFNQEGYMQATEDEIRDYYNQATNLQKTFGSFDRYMEYMNERQDLIDSGEYDPGSYGQIVDTGMVQNVDGTMIDPSDIQNLSRNDFISKYGLDPSEVEIVKTETGADRTAGYRDWIGSESVQELNKKYGIPDVRATDDGREYMWNGTAWVKSKEPESFDFGDVAKIVAGVGMTVLVGGAVAGKLAGALANAGMSQAAATAAANGIVSATTQYLTTGDVDLKQAIISAAGGYLSEAGVGNLLGDSEVGKALSDVADAAQEKIKIFQEAISTGSEIADAAIQAGGMSMLVGLVENGEVDLKQALGAALIAGGAQGLQELSAGVGLNEDELQQFFNEDDELRQAAIDADIKDPFLNPNYSSVGDGLIVDTDGNVFNYDGSNVGNMNELDINNDGMLTGSDLQEINVDAQQRVDTDAMGLQPWGSLDDSYSGAQVDIYSDESGNLYDASGNQIGEVTLGKEGVVTVNGEDFIVSSDVQDSGVIDFEQQTGSKILEGSEPVYYSSDTNTYRDSGEAVSDEHGYYLVRGEDGIIYITDGNAIEKYKGGNYGGDDPLINDTLESMYNEKSLAWQHIHGGGTLPNGPGVDQTTGQVIFPEQITETQQEQVTDQGGGGGVTTDVGGGDGGSQGGPETIVGPTTQIDDPVVQSIASQTGLSPVEILTAINSGLTENQIIDMADSGTVSSTDVSISGGGTTAVVTGAEGGGNIASGGAITGGGGESGNGGIGGGGSGSGSIGGQGGGGAIGGGVESGSGLGGGVDNGGGGGEGGGEGGGKGPGSGPGEGGIDQQDRRSGFSTDFEPYSASLFYETPTILNIIQNKQTDYVAPLDSIINKGMFTGRAV